jgi:hypothetical protein
LPRQGKNAPAVRTCGPGNYSRLSASVWAESTISTSVETINSATAGERVRPAVSNVSVAMCTVCYALLADFREQNNKYYIILYFAP